jgi:prepilin-type N-terminal cleavage/methylation domain-containing protein
MYQVLFDMYRLYVNKNVDKPMSGRYHNPMEKRGMALVEIVVSMIVLAVAALAVTSAVSVVGNQTRSAGGGSLDLQALSYARETLESLKNAVSADATRALPLRDNTANCVPVAAGNPCGAGEVHTTDATLPTSDLLDHAGTRSYRVQNISDGSGIAGRYAYKRVTVSLAWTD